MYAHHRLVADLAGPGRARPISEALLDATIADIVAADPGVGIVTELRTVTAAPIVVIPAPLPRAGGCTADHDAVAFGDPGRLRALVGRHRAVVDGAVASLGAVTCWQPDDTIDGGVYTREEFGAGVVRLGPTLAVPAPPSPMTLNRAFGERVLKLALDALTGCP
jgi:hypothetical protein